jgi:hypothetical protein
MRILTRLVIDVLGLIFRVRIGSEKRNKLYISDLVDMNGKYVLTSFKFFIRFYKVHTKLRKFIQSTLFLDKGWVIKECKSRKIYLKLI